MIDRQEARSDVAMIDPAADRWLHTANRARATTDPRVGRLVKHVSSLLSHVILLSFVICPTGITTPPALFFRGRRSTPPTRPRSPWILPRRCARRRRTNCSNHGRLLQDNVLTKRLVCRDLLPMTGPRVRDTQPVSNILRPLAAGSFSKGTNLGMMTDW
jgi:hypothetical protein